MDQHRLVPMRRCPTCGAMIFLNPATDETVYSCVCLEQAASFIEDTEDTYERSYEKRLA